MDVRQLGGDLAQVLLLEVVGGASLHRRNWALKGGMEVGYLVGLVRLEDAVET